MDTAMALTEEATLERFNASQDRVAKHLGFGATEGALGITRAYLGELSSYIDYQLHNIDSVSSRSPEKAFLKAVAPLGPDVLALATLSGMLSSVATGQTTLRTCIHLGTLVAGELFAKGLLEHSPDLSSRISLAVRRRHGNLQYRKQAARVIAARAGFKSVNWSNPERVRAGSFMLAWALGGLPDVFTRDTGGDPQIVAAAIPLAEEAVEQVLCRNPAWQPSSEPIRPWTGFLDGGYWDSRMRMAAPLVRVRRKPDIAAIKGAMKDGSMAPHIDGLNALQAVPWAINERVLEVLKWAYEHEVKVKGVPSKSPVPEPERLSDAEWANEDLRRLQRHRISQVKEYNRGLSSNRVLFAQDTATADRLVGSRFYTPVNSDWRGRVYPVCHFNFQRDDRVRALFMFADGMPLGEGGLSWLKVHVANCGDFDKISKRPFEERVRWVDSRLNIIRFITETPKDPKAREWWTQADSPFLFLASCMELTAALRAGPSFVTRLPVSFDGSCSGLQHLCAMTRAPEGSLVNLTPQTLPQDVYQTVADLVQTRVAADANTANASDTATLAQQCIDYGITRKLVKRNVMTYAYSSKKFGMSQQLVEDVMKPLGFDVLSGKLKAHPFGEDEGRAASKYLAGHIYDAIEEVVELPAKAMAFLQGCARALAHEGKPLSWTTPTGLPWCNRYNVPDVQRLQLWLSDTRVQMLVADGHKPEIDKDKSANGVAPNFVHALDAAHLLLTTNACVAEGIVAIATVHDSFGCLAPQAGRFNQIIREQFVQMYEEHDVLAEVLKAAWRDLTVHNWHRLPPVPEYGSLDLKVVLDAPFAFA
jgi:DNA-directed RNA polymerase